MAKKIAWAKKRGSSRSRSRSRDRDRDRNRSRTTRLASSSDDDRFDDVEKPRGFWGNLSQAWDALDLDLGLFESKEEQEREQRLRDARRYRAIERSRGREAADRWIEDTRRDRERRGVRADKFGSDEEASWFNTDEENQRILDEQAQERRERYGTDEMRDENRQRVMDYMYNIERPEASTQMMDYIDEMRENMRNELARLDARRQETRALWEPYNEKWDRSMRTRQENQQSMKRGWETTAQDAWKNWARDRNLISGRWEFDRSRQEGDWLNARRAVLDQWNPLYRREMGELRDIRSQQQELLEEVKEAPSTVLQQARQAYDKQLQGSISAAAMMGRGVSGGRVGLRNQLAMQGADLMNQTAVARSQEHLNRLGLQSTFLDKQAALSGQMIDVGLNDAQLRRQLGLDTFNVYNRSATQSADILRNLGTTSYNIKRQLGLDTANMWKVVNDQELQNMYERRSNLQTRVNLDALDLESAKAGFNFQSAMLNNMRNTDADERAWQSMFANNARSWAGLDSSTDLSYLNAFENMYRYDQQMADAQLQQINERGDARLRGVLELGGTLLGGLLGGGQGAMMGSQISGAFGNAFAPGSQIQSQGSMFGGNAQQLQNQQMMFNSIFGNRQAVPTQNWNTFGGVPDFSAMGQVA